MKGYVQLRRGLLEHLKIMSPQEITVYIGILLMANFKTASVNATVAELSDVVDICYKATLKAIRRLEKLGYVKYTQAHNQWEVSKIHVLRYHNGKNASVYNAEPLTEPLTEADSITPRAVSDVGKVNNSKEYIRNIKKELLDFPHLKDEIFSKVFDEFLVMRKSIKKPATEHAKMIILTKLSKHDLNTATKMLNNAIEKSWLSVYPINSQLQEGRRLVA